MNQNPETKKKTMGRKKIEIKSIENKKHLAVTFSKRKSGLFKKASELSLVTGAEIAILVQSPTEKMFGFSNVCVDSVLDRFQTGLIPTSVPDSRTVPFLCKREYEEAECELQKEKKRANQLRTQETKNWWDEPVEGFSELHELEEYLEALEGLKGTVMERVGDIEKSRMVENCGLNFEVGESSSNLLGLGDGTVCGYGDPIGRLSGYEVFDQEGEFIPFKDLRVENMNMDDRGSSSSSNVINCPTEHQFF